MSRYSLGSQSASGDAQWPLPRHRPQLWGAGSGLCPDCGSLIGMRTTIDKAGRLVIPRSLRDSIGLASGGPVEVELDGAGIRIEPVAGRELREEEGLLLIPALGVPIDETFVRALIDADRRRR